MKFHTIIILLILELFITEFHILNGQSSVISLDVCLIDYTYYRVYKNDTFLDVRISYTFESSIDTSIIVDQNAFDLNSPLLHKLDKVVFSKKYLTKHIDELEECVVLLENKRGRYRLYKNIYNSNIEPKFVQFITSELSNPKKVSFVKGESKTYYFSTYLHFLKVRNKDKFVRIHYFYRNSNGTFGIISSNWINLNQTIKPPPRPRLSTD